MQLGEELVDLATNTAGDLAEIIRHGLHRIGALAGFRGGLAHAVDLAGGVVRALGGGLDAARDLLSGGALLGDGGGDRARNVADLADGPLDRADRLDRAHGGVLHAGDLRADVLGRLGGLPGQRLDFARHHGEAAARLAGTRRLDGGVEREQVGLLGDIGDQPHHVADAAGSLVELRDRGIGGLRLAHRLAGDGVRLRHLAVDLGHRSGKLICRRGDVAHVLRCVGRRSRRSCGAGRGIVGGAGELA